MLANYAQLLQNFVYKAPDLRMINTLPGFVDVLRYVFSRELSCAEAFCRKFVWYRETLWLECIPANCLLVLGGKDDLVPVEHVRTLMRKTGHPCKVNSPLLFCEILPPPAGLTVARS